MFIVHDKPILKSAIKHIFFNSAMCNIATIFIHEVMTVIVENLVRRRLRAKLFGKASRLPQT